MASLRRAARVLPLLRKYLRASRALRYAERRDAPGTEFARFGRQLGMRLLARGSALGVPYLITPVSITRYFEFDFVSKHVPTGAHAFLDVSSPRLLSLFVASTRPSAFVEILNPDQEDAETTRAITDRLRFTNVAISSDGVEVLLGRSRRYDCIWSISVVEHIAGDNGDTEAMRLMYDVLRPGGRLIVTVPADRRFWHEFRDDDYYGTQREMTPLGKYFFQRLYDEATVRARLVEPLGREPTIVAWFGERTAGTFHAYERRWIVDGPDVTIDDPRRIADEYARFGSWGSMPGFGVCALVIDKPQVDESVLS